MRNLFRRVERLEDRFHPAREPFEHVIQFVDSDGTISSTLTIRHGAPDAGTWWYAPGHGPDDSADARQGQRQMPADALR